MTKAAVVPAGMTVMGTPRPGVHAGAMSALTFKDIMGIIRRRLLLIALATVLITIAAVGLWFVCLRYYPEYRSVAYLRVKMPEQPNLLTRMQMLPREEILAGEAANKAALMGNEVFLREVLGRTMVRETDWFKSFPDEENRLEDFKDNFSASPMRNSGGLVSMSMAARSREESRRILDEVLDQFMSRERELATGALRERLAALQREQDSKRTRLNAQRQELVQLVGSVAVAGWQTAQSVVMEKVRTLGREILITQAQLDRAESQKLQLEQEKQARGYSSLVESSVESNNLVLGWRNRIAGLQEQKDKLLERLGQEHMEVKEVDAQIQSAQRQLDEQRSQLMQQYTIQESQQLEDSINMLRETLLGIQDEYETTSKQQQDLEVKLADRERIQMEIEEQREDIRRLQSLLDETRVSIDDKELVRAEIAARANLPLELSFPKLAVFLPGGIVVGLLVGFGLAFLLEFMDDSVKSPSDVSRHLHVPLLGMVPQYEDEESDTIPVEKITQLRPHAIISEFYRQIKTNLSFMAPEGELKIILVTSGTTSSGKTTVASNMAITEANAGKRVLLVDASFRHPMLEKLFGGSNAPGLSNLLVGQVTASEVIHASDVEGLEVVNSGPLPPSPADLLNSPRMREFLAAQKEAYDYVIIDGPPSLVVTDSRILASQVCGTIIVLKAGETSRGVATRVIREMTATRGRILGVVLNQVRPHKGGYFRETYQSYYDYVGDAVSSRGGASVPMPVGAGKEEA